MNKKILLGLGTILAVVAGVAAMSAYEAHVINVTAHIENALRIIAPEHLNFGTVFPQEYRKKSISITTSESFCASDQLRVLAIDYKIVQKPKCVNESGEYAPVNWDTHQCPEGYREMPLLCPYLSKTPMDGDLEPYDDHGVPAFHDLSAIGTGTIHKKNDLQDEWIIDLPVPCYKGYCSQDWPAFVASHNPDADPNLYQLVGNPEGTDFGCDLWVEVMKIY